MAKCLIVDPCNYDKKDAFEKGIELVTEFMNLNEIELPSEIRDSSTDGRKKAGTLRVDYGYYESPTARVNVNLSRSRCPVKTPGFQWSYTAFKSDLTAPGILAHEIGHHVHDYLGSSYSRTVKGIVHEFFEHVKAEERVSSYEPNPYESWAEAMRLFILNPSLLQEGRPLRYDFFVKHAKLQPIVDRQWREILVNAHPRLIAAAESWIKKNLRVSR